MSPLPLAPFYSSSSHPGLLCCSHKPVPALIGPADHDHNHNHNHNLPCPIPVLVPNLLWALGSNTLALALPLALWLLFVQEPRLFLAGCDRLPLALSLICCLWQESLSQLQLYRLGPWPLGQHSGQASSGHKGCCGGLEQRWQDRVACLQKSLCVDWQLNWFIIYDGRRNYLKEYAREWVGIHAGMDSGVPGILVFFVYCTVNNLA